MMTQTCDRTISKDMAAASYFGLEVDVLWKMQNCSLIHFEGREFVVETSDLVFHRRAANSFDQSLKGELTSVIRFLDHIIDTLSPSKSAPTTPSLGNCKFRP